jgi:glutaminyl-tRNA synthetase
MAPQVDASPAEVRPYDRLFTATSPTNLAADLDPHSMQTLAAALSSGATASDPLGQALQFERQGFSNHDGHSRPTRLVFNRTNSLR